MTVATMKFHPVCEAFPLMDEHALGELTADIRKHGLRESIWRHRDGSIVDGRNRYLACTRAAVTPKFRTFEGADSALPAFVVSLNILRRHLDESQRAMVAAKLANLTRGGDRRSDQRPDLAFDPVTNAAAAKLLNVGKSTVKAARAVQQKGVPELVSAVEKGEVAVTVAEQIAKLPEADQRKAVESRTVKAPTRKAPSRKVAPKRTHYAQAIEEARAWMRKWAHVGGALAPIFDAITATIEQARKEKSE